MRRLIDRVKADLSDLTAEEQAQIGEAVAVVRRSRSVMLGMPRIGQPLPDVHTTTSARAGPWPTAAAPTVNAAASA